MQQDSLVGLGTTGKVIASGPNDRVFVYFSDHGAPGKLHHTALSSCDAFELTGCACAINKCTLLSSHVHRHV